MSEDRSTPEIRFRGYLEDWKQRKLKESFTFPVSTNTLPRSQLNYRKGKIMSIHYGDILIKYDSILEIKKDKIPFITNGIVEKYKSNLLENGDIIFADAAEDETVGKAVEINGIVNEYIVAGLHTIVARPKERKAKYFLGYYINTNIFHRQLLRLMQGAKVSSISKRSLRKTNVAYPKDLKEQQKIGTFFKQLDNTIALHQRKLDHLESLKQAYLRQLFPQNEEKVPSVRFANFSKKWEQRKLGSIGTTYTGLSGKTKSDFGHGDAYFIPYKNVFNNPVANPMNIESIEIDKKQNQVCYGDILFTVSSETPEEVAMSSVWLEEVTNLYLNSFCFGYRLVEPQDLHFMAFLLRSPLTRKKFILLSQGISRYNISKNKMMNIEICIPKTDEQKQIGIFLNTLNNLINFHAKSIQQFELMKKYFLQKIFI